MPPCCQFEKFTFHELLEYICLIYSKIRSFWLYTTHDTLPVRLYRGNTVRLDMGNIISPNILARASMRISALMGLHFPEDKWTDLERIISEAAPALGFSDVVAFAEWLVSVPLQKGHIEKLADYLTVGETYFFREKESFDILEGHILPPLIRSRRNGERCLRIWSAGCCTGEEPYSIAILLTRMIADWKDWNITILATDINLHFLKKALVGKYTEWSFRNAPVWLKECYFRKTAGGYYEILPSIRRMVAFEQLNLAEDVYPSPLNNLYAMDLIFCRNVLMYFSPERAKKAIGGFYQTLADNGMFIVSLTESVKLSGSPFVATSFRGITFYRKPARGEIVEDVVSGKQVAGGEKIIRNVGENGFKESQLPDAARTSSDIPAASSRDIIKGVEEEQRGPEGWHTPYEEALLLYKQGRYAEAKEKIYGWVEYELSSPKEFTLLARICANQGKLDDAEMWCEKAIIADRCCAINYYLLATIVMEKGRIDEAIVLLKRALYLDPHFALAHFVLANLLMRGGKRKLSGKYFNNAFDIVAACRPDEIVPESEGITAGRLMEIITVMKRA